MITVAQVAQANELELICLTYDIFLENIELAISNSSDTKKYKAIARKVLLVLINNLDMQHELSHDLFDLYIYVQRLIIENKFEDAKEIITSIKEGYEALKAKGITTQKTVSNTQDIYAGMTYGKNSINEVILGNNNRGFTI